MDFRMTSDGIIAIDHVSLPMQHTDAMIAFYGALGFDRRPNPSDRSAGHAGLYAPRTGTGRDREYR